MSMPRRLAGSLVVVLVSLAGMTVGPLDHGPAALAAGLFRRSAGPARACGAAPTDPDDPSEDQPEAAAKGPRGAGTYPKAPADADAYTVRTPDGWQLVLFRYRSADVPAGRPRAGAAPTLPVILCHGFSYNGLFWDLDPEHSLARYLAQRGHDVWVVNLRGSGLSTKWVHDLRHTGSVLLGEVSRALGPDGYATIDPRYSQWTLDDYIGADVPAILLRVKGVTGAAQVAWVGHSMGGIVMLGYLARYPDPSVARLVTIGSQVTMPRGPIALKFLSDMLRQRERQIAGYRFRPEPFGTDRSLFFNLANTDPEVIRTLSAVGCDTPSLGLLAQYMRLSHGGELVSADGKFNYARSMNRLTCPILIAGGAADRLAPPQVQRELFERVGAADKRLLILGRDAGFRVDYGHNDSLIGRAAPLEVFPLIDRWLTGQSLTPPAAGPDGRAAPGADLRSTVRSAKPPVAPRRRFRILRRRAVPPVVIPPEPNAPPPSGE